MGGNPGQSPGVSRAPASGDDAFEGRESLSFHVPWLIFAVVTAVALLWTHRLYVSLPLPRQPQEFRPAQELEKALASAQSALQKDAEDLSALTELTLVHFERGPDHYLEGLEALERARELGVLDVRLFYVAAVMYEGLGLLDHARPDYERFLRHRPEDTEARLRLGNLYYRLGEVERAAAAYEKVREAKPKDATVAFNLALAYRDQRRWSDGLGVMEPLLAAGASLPGGSLKLTGDLYHGLGDFSRALEHYHRQLAHTPDDPELAQALALTYERMDDLPQALAQWERLLQINPKHRLARERVRSLQKKIKSAEKNQKR